MAGGRIVYVAGAGVAGLTLALALAKFGATVIVVERQKAVQEIGAGLQLSPNARRILDRLGLDKALAERAFAPEGIDVYPFRARRPLLTLELGDEAARRFGAPYAVLHRADLVDVLYRACKRFANIQILFGVRNHDAIGHARGVTVNIEEADGVGRSARAFAFVGADGVNSPTRTRGLGGPAAVYSGLVAWRTTLPQQALAGVLANDRSSLLFGPGYHAVAYPLPHRGQLNLVLVAKVAEADAFGSSPPKAPELPWSLMKSLPFEAIGKAADGAWGYWPLSSVAAETWHAGGVGIIGDAAHAMLPFQAQGAAMAIEDAAILAPLLMTEADAESAFRRYAALRQPRVERVRRLSASNGFAFHLEWPLTLGRDTVLLAQGRRGHLARLAWLYGYDTAPDPEISHSGRRRARTPG